MNEGGTGGVPGGASANRIEQLVGRWLLAATLVLVVCSVVAEEGRPYGVPGGKFFTVGTEANLWTWFNVVVLFLAALAHAVAGLQARQVGRPFAWFVIVAVLILGLSIDDLTALHERLGGVGTNMGGGYGLLAFAWVVPGALIGVAVAVAVVCLARQLPPRPKWLLVVGLGMFLGAALGLESVSALVLQHNSGWPYRAVATVEETFEALGAILLLRSALATLTFAADRGTVSIRSRLVPRDDAVLSGMGSSS